MLTHQSPVTLLHKHNTPSHERSLPLRPYQAAPMSTTAASVAEVDVAVLHRRLRIRQYVPNDHATVVTLFTKGMRSYPGQDGEGHLRYIQWSLETDLADVQGTYIAPGGNFWIATISEGADGDEETIGMIAYQPNKDERGDGELRRLSVKSAFRQFGIGKILVTHLEQWAKASGFTSVSLKTGTVMHNACLFYKKIGYTLTKTENASGHYELAYFRKELV